MSATEPADLRAFRELETLVHNLGDELAVFRKRALAAEAQLRETGQDVPPTSRTSVSIESDSDLASENRALRTRVERAEERVRQLMDRVRFLRQQIQSAVTLPAGRS
jgi:hypothetical protein